MPRTIPSRSLAALAAFVLLACGGGKKKPDSDMPVMHGPDASMPPVLDAGGPTHVHVPHGMVNEVDQSDGGTPMRSGFGVEPPRGPRSTARIRVLVVSTGDTHVPLVAASASAGGKAVSLGDSGFGLIDEVYGKDSADVLVRAMDCTEGRARVPIRAGETSFVVIMLADMQSAKIEDLAKGDKIEGTEQIPDSSVDAGFVIKPAVTLDLPADALVAPWGAAASGGGTFTYVLLDDPEQAAVVPNGTSALAKDGSRVELQLRALFEVHVAQGGTPFALTKPAGVDVPLAAETVTTTAGGGAADAGAGAGSDRLYWLDPSTGGFVARDAITETDGVAHGSIDHFGLWAIGRPATGLGCVHGQVLDGTGAGLPFAVLRVTQDAGLGSQLLWTDASGNYCVEGTSGSTRTIFGVGSSAASGLMRIDSPIGAAIVPANAPAPLCGGDASACAVDGAITAMSYGLRCVQGMIEETAWGVSWSAVPTTATESGGAGGNIESGKPFCIEVPGDSMLSFITASGTCGDMVAIPAGTAQLCDDSPTDCVDLGTLKCCDAQESCGDSKDNDCDDMVDEGCTCGSTTCLLGNDICCTAADACGLHAPQTKKCLAPDTTGFANGMCPDATFDGVPLTGCCRSDMRCGVTDGQFGFGCVAREDAADVYPLDASLAPQSCTQ